MIRQRDIAFKARDWVNREVVLLKSTIRQHISRFHLDEVFVIDQLKRSIAQPRVVIENRGARSEQAIYDIAAGGHRCLQVNIKYKALGKNLIVSLYGVDQDPPGRVLWPKR